MREIGPRPTLGELQRIDALAMAVVRTLPASRAAIVAVAVIRWGPNASSDKLRAGARCTRCGRKGAM